jgi:hypothetical protein
MKTKHVVVDGSNIATEGRATPSLAQLDSAVRALLDEYPYEHTTVVVDATFGHRIDAKERKAFEEAVLQGEVITPPAGAIGRGDAFVLQIADRADADVFSNDSFQEFHGQYSWLFDEGRLVGGKPVPNVGWVFVLRAPVRGPTSRRSVRDAQKGARKETRKGPVKKTAPPKGTKAVTKSAAKAPVDPPAVAPPVPSAPPGRPARPAPSAESRSRRRRPTTSAEPINDQLVYAGFVVDHPVGTVVDGVVDRFSSHGAYVHVGDAQCYAPLREMGDPPPRSAREVLNLGETRPFTVQRFDPARRGIDVVPVSGAVPKTERGRPAAEAVAVAAGSTNQETDAEEAPVSPAARKAAKRKAPAKRKTAAKRAPAKRKTAAKRAPAKRKTAAKRAPAKRKTAAKRAPAKRKAAAKKTTAKRKTAARKAPAKRKAAKRKAPAKRKAAKRKAPAKRKTAARKAPAKRKATRKRAAAKKR